MTKLIERAYTPSKVELREADGRPVLEGYAALYDSLSVNLGGFVERIAPGAFDAALESDPDVLCRIQHEDGLQVIGRTKSGTLTLRATSEGLHYTCLVPDTQAGRDIVELVRRGDIDQSSFAFSIDRDSDESWDWNHEPTLRTLLRVNLHDVAPVSTPAYPETTVGLRAETLERARQVLERELAQAKRRRDALRAAHRQRAEHFRALSARAKSRR